MSTNRRHRFQLHLWILRTDEPGAGASAARVVGILSADERSEALRFHRAADRHQFILARALARLALSGHLAVAPGEWRFRRDPQGKPFIAAPESAAGTRFSISHTRGLVACLVSSDAEAGVDVEEIEHHADLAGVALDILAPAERNALSALAGMDWTARFYDYWTLKEAYAKARGLGLGMAFNDIGFELNRDDTVRADFAPAVGDDPSAWVFWRRRLPPRHTISVAAKKDCGDRCEVVLRAVEL